GAKAVAGGSGGGSGSADVSAAVAAAEADRTSVLDLDRSAEATSLETGTMRLDALLSAKARVGGAFLSSSRLEMEGFAAATITFEGAGAGEPSRSVAMRMVSSLPSSGAGPTYSTRTCASPRL